MAAMTGSRANANGSARQRHYVWRKQQRLYCLSVFGKLNTETPQIHHLIWGVSALLTYYFSTSECTIYR